MNTVSYAGFWRRFVAYMIDSILLGIVSFILLIPALGLFGLGSAVNSDEDPNGSSGLMIAAIGAYILAILAILVASWLYFALMEASAKGGTLGKMAMGIRVTDLQGNQVTFARATGRYFAKFLSSAIFGIGYFMAGFTQQKQALHDILAGCLVVNR